MFEEPFVEEVLEYVGVTEAFASVKRVVYAVVEVDTDGVEEGFVRIILKEFKDLHLGLHLPSFGFGANASEVTRLEVDGLQFVETRNAPLSDRKRVSRVDAIVLERFEDCADVL